MYFGGTVIASAWGVVALASVWSKKMSEGAAFWGMLLGFLGCVIPKTYSALSGVTLPIYLDPFFIGIVMSIIGMVIGNKLKSASVADIAEYEKGWSQEQLGAMVGFSQSKISKIENGNCDSSSDLRLIAKALEVPIAVCL